MTAYGTHRFDFHVSVALHGNFSCLLGLGNSANVGTRSVKSGAMTLVSGDLSTIVRRSPGAPNKASTSNTFFSAGAQRDLSLNAMTVAVTRTTVSLGSEPVVI